MKEHDTRFKQLLEEYFSGSPDPEMTEVIKGWIANAGNRGEKDKALEKLFLDQVNWDRNPSTGTLRSLEKVHRILGFPDKTQRTVPLRRRMAFKVAAVLIPIVLVLGGALILFNNNRTKETELPGINTLAQQISVETFDGDSKCFTLPDGSEVTMRDGTRLSYSKDFTTSRNVYMEGEAFFRVKKMDGRTFTVNSNSITVTVLGTEFTVKAYGNKPTSEVLLASGKVSVAAEGIETTTMTPGQHFVYHKNHGTVAISDIEIEELMRMRGMSLNFDNTLDEIFRTVAQYFSIEIDAEPGAYLSRSIVVPFKGNESPEEVMKLLRDLTSGAFEYEIRQDTILVTKSR